MKQYLAADDRWWRPDCWITTPARRVDCIRRRSRRVPCRHSGSQVLSSSINGCRKSSEQHFAYRAKAALDKPVVRDATLYARARTGLAWINGTGIVG